MLYTVKDHLSGILRKVGLKSRIESSRAGLLVETGLLFLALDGGLDLSGIGERHASDVETAAVVDLDG